MRIPRFRFLLYLIYCLALIVTLAFAFGHVASPARLSLALAFAIGILVPVVLILFPNVNLAEPLYWFSAMYYWFFIAALYFIFTDFETSQHIVIDDRSERWRVMEYVLGLILSGYVMLLAGYLLVRRHGLPRDVQLQLPDTLPDALLYVVIGSFLVIGVVNFLYFTGSYPGGTVAYFQDIGIRTHRYEFLEDAAATTLGYQLVYASVFLWAFVIIRSKKHHSMNWEILGFVAAVLISLVVLASESRMFQLVSYVMVLTGLFYVNSTSRRKNTVFVGTVASFVAIALLLYVLRVISALAYANPEALIGLSSAEIAAAAGRGMTFLLIDKGNVPNIPILMNIVENWEHSFGLEYGRTFLNWTAALLPGLEPENMGMIIRDNWYMSVGGLPPTVLGELYANFGAPGVYAGMFLIGALMAGTYNVVRSRRDFWVYLVFLAVSFRFFLVWPKGESMNIAGAVWLFLPAVGAVLLVRMVAVVLMRRSRV